MFQYVSVSSASGDDLLLCKGLRSASALGCLGFDAYSNRLICRLGSLPARLLQRVTKTSASNEIDA